MHTHLDLGDVEGPCRTAQEGPPRKGQSRQALQATFVERARAILQARTALQQRRDVWVRLEALKLLIGAQVGVAVVEGHHKPGVGGFDQYKVHEMK